MSGNCKNCCKLIVFLRRAARYVSMERPHITLHILKLHLQTYMTTSYCSLLWPRVAILFKAYGSLFAIRDCHQPQYYWNHEMIMEHVNQTKNFPWMSLLLYDLSAWFIQMQPGLVKEADNTLAKLKHPLFSVSVWTGWQTLAKLQQKR